MSAETVFNGYLLLAALLFVIGMAGVLVRRNAIVIFICIELMLNAVNLTLVTLATRMGQVTGHAFVLFVMAVAAAEAAVGLAIIISLFRNSATIDVERINLLKG
ncbi:MAG: NADH-quinone oxidoreductase subunit NuoK [Candidatus Alcyoniella australis]|nr:NADH-quinone oxidoreductase subunit NuoK [Candidatus Alcyoniella australis]